MLRFMVRKEGCSRRYFRLVLPTYCRSLRGMLSLAYEVQQVRHSSCSGNVMADRYLEAVQCLDLIAPERFAEALETADARAGLRSVQEGRDPALMEIVFSVPDEQFWWFRLVLRRMADKYERHKRIVQAYRKLNSPRST